MATVQITIPDVLAKKAAAEGLLEPGAIEAIPGKKTRDSPRSQDAGDAVQVLSKRNTSHDG